MKPIDDVAAELKTDLLAMIEREKAEFARAPERLEQQVNGLVAKFKAELESRAALVGGINLEDWDGVRKLRTQSNRLGYGSFGKNEAKLIVNNDNTVDPSGEYQWFLGGGDDQQTTYYEFLVLWRKKVDKK